jgi:hypothetical protein
LHVKGYFVCKRLWLDSPGIRRKLGILGILVRKAFVFASFWVDVALAVWGGEPFQPK